MERIHKNPKPQNQEHKNPFKNNGNGQDKAKLLDGIARFLKSDDTGERKKGLDLLVAERHGLPYVSQEVRKIISRFLAEMLPKLDEEMPLMLIAANTEDEQTRKTAIKKLEDRLQELTDPNSFMLLAAFSDDQKTRFSAVNMFFSSADLNNLITFLNWMNANSEHPDSVRYAEKAFVMLVASGHIASWDDVLIVDKIKKKS